MRADLQDHVRHRDRSCSPPVPTLPFHSLVHLLEVFPSLEPVFLSTRFELVQRLLRLKFAQLNEARNRINVTIPRNVSRSCAVYSDLIVETFIRYFRYLMGLDCHELLHEVGSITPGVPVPPGLDRVGQVNRALRLIFGDPVVDELVRPETHRVTHAERKKTLRAEANASRKRAREEEARQTAQSWPQTVSEEDALGCCQDYLNAFRVRLPDLCACCARRPQGKAVCTYAVKAADPTPSYLTSLSLQGSDPVARGLIGLDHPAFMFGNPALDGLMLDRRAVTSVDGGSSITICDACIVPLKSGRVPKYALRNNLYRGELPEEFADLTPVEEMVCALSCTTAQVTRVFHSTDEASPFVFHGNTCSHDMNVVSTASVLPRTAANVLGNLTVVFVGPGPVKESALRNMFRIRKWKVWGFLLWLKAHNTLYRDLDLSPLILNEYPEDGIFPGLMQSVIHDDRTDVREVVEEETAGFAAHPTAASRPPEQPETPVAADSTTYMESMGVLDGELDLASGHTLQAAALRNIMKDSRAPPDLTFRRGRTPCSEYNNPALIPGSFPTIYPLGIGGFDDKSRPTALSFQKQAQYCFDTHDKRFRSHRVFMFVVLNILQRRTGHLQTYFTTRRSNFEYVAEKLNSLTPEIVDSVAEHLENHRSEQDMSPEQKKVMDVLYKVNTISANVPGSHASKIRLRNEIRSYMGYKGLPHIYLTMNPSPAHSPVFQVMYGDETVNLFDQFPQLVPSRERALRLAADPVAAADFFDHSITCFLQEMLGWDPVRKKSKPKGGILGKVDAYYGTAEYTERGCLHGHFLIWLEGGLNPREVHSSLADNPDFQKRFLSFFDDISRHDLGPIEMNVEKTYEPRVEMPPPIPLTDAEKARWAQVFATHVKMCGEVLQRHGHRPVCFKYGRVDKCRFLFPHDIVKEARFDPETNSIYLTCLDPWVNYYNPYILVFCRHNHDIKCILSGKAAKSAMFYITDYITKMDLKTHEMLSLMSRAVAAIPPPDCENRFPLERAKMVLHKCLSQFTKRQQIHAQQAVRYLRGLGDSMQSHKTVSMMSAGIVDAFLTAGRFDRAAEAAASLTSSEVEETVEPSSLPVFLNRNGKAQIIDQVLDYIHRGDGLAHMCFYDFVRFVKKVPIGKSDADVLVSENFDEDDEMAVPNLDSRDDDEGDRNGRKPRHSFMPSHPQHETHELMQKSDESVLFEGRELIPRVVGCSIPRPSKEHYHAFMLAHFRPFRFGDPLCAMSSTKALFETYSFNEFHRSVMENWDAIHECEDERDQERLRKQASASKPNQSVLNEWEALQSGDVDDISPIDLAYLQSLGKDDVGPVNSVVSKLEQCGWFPDKESAAPATKSTGKSQDNLSDAMGSVKTIDKAVAAWVASAKAQDRLARLNRRKVWQPTCTEAEDVPMGDTLDAEQFRSEVHVLRGDAEADTSTIAAAYFQIAAPAVQPLDDIDEISRLCGLNKEQDLAFRIVGEHFMGSLVTDASGTSPPAKPLRMFMTGPGGTGKTWVVRALKMLMDKHHQGHRIRYLAPTGSAAALIDGTTVHTGLGIRIEKKSGQGKGNRIVGTSSEDWSVVMDPEKRKDLEDEWRHVDYVLIDEISMVSQQLLCEIDHALRNAKRNFDDPFGGASVIFSGDQYQFQPVGGTALYTPIPGPRSVRGAMTESAMKARLGRLVWKTVDTVVEFHEQHRMKSDPEYAAAVARLRLRRCTASDVVLFNSRVVRSTACPQGLRMPTCSATSIPVTAIVATNVLREVLNTRQASAFSKFESTTHPVVCEAIDAIDKKIVSDVNLRNQLLNHDRSSSEKGLPGKIPLHVGMPVILKGKNLATELKVTNGARGVVHRILTDAELDGRSAKCVLVEFPNSPISIPGLPRGVYPIVPHRESFDPVVKCSEPRAGEPQFVKLKVSRRQLPIQPAYAITGHCAQGQTLPSVVCDLNTGGFGAYVAASRACARGGLYLLDHVNIDKLNTPVSSHLSDETERLSAIARNTLIQRGILSGPKLPVPDAEAGVSSTNPVTLPATQNNARGSGAGPKTPVRPDAPQRTSRAPKRTIMDANVDVDGNKRAKRVKRNTRWESGPTATSSIGGPTWDASNWSCAYDTVFVPFYHMYREGSAGWRTSFRSFSPLANSVSDIFETVLQSGELVASPSEVMNAGRNSFRRALAVIDPTEFGLTGPLMAPMTDILLHLCDAANRSVLCQPRVTSSDPCPPCSTVTDLLPAAGLQTLLHSGAWADAEKRSMSTGSASSASIAMWCSMLNVPVIRPACSRTQCLTTRSLRIALPDPPPFLHFEVNRSDVVPQPLATPTLSFRNLDNVEVLYNLRAVLYWNGAHYHCRYIDSHARLFAYDGQKHDGVGVLESELSDAATSTWRQVLIPPSGSFANVFVYAKA